MKKIEENRNMKMKKSLLAALLGALVLLLCACGESQDQVNYPALDAPDLDTMTLSQVANSSVRVKYDADEWIAVPNLDPLTFYYMETSDSEDEAVNININYLGGDVNRLAEGDMADLVAGLTEAYSDLNLQVKEMRTLAGEPVIYMEGTMQMTDQMIDQLIQQGAFTQEDIDALGGREVLLAIPPTDQVYLFVNNGGDLFLCTGTYYADDQKAVVVDAMTVLARTAESVT